METQTHTTTPARPPSPLHSTVNEPNDVCLCDCISQYAVQYGFYKPTDNLNMSVWIRSAVPGRNRRAANLDGWIWSWLGGDMCSCRLQSRAGTQTGIASSPPSSDKTSLWTHKSSMCIKKLRVLENTSAPVVFCGRLLFVWRKYRWARRWFRGCFCFGRIFMFHRGFSWVFISVSVTRFYVC